MMPYSISVRWGLSQLLDNSCDMAVVGECRNGKEALAFCERLQPDLILMDIKMPEMDGITATQIIRQRYPQVKVIMLSTTPSKENLKDACRAGAHAFLDKSVSIDEILNTIRVAYGNC